MAAITRRGALSGVLAAIAAAGLPGGASVAAALSEQGLDLGAPQPFSFDTLKAQAAALAANPWKDPTSPYADILQKIDYTAFHQINFRRSEALWAAAESGPPVELFHLGRYFLQPVSIRVVADGSEREIIYHQSYFDMPAEHVAHQLPDGIGFAGFRVMAEDQTWDWLAFLGASYFRSPGAARQYGMSSRGLAIDTGLPKGEEFPRFSTFWLEAVPGTRDRVIIYALLDSPSVVGAYRFDCAYGNGVTMDVEMQIVARKSIERTGIAPLTSMFWYSETDKTKGLDWRPEIHDSDGLALWTGAGERIWRPLNDPPSVMTNSFFDENPKGFGLLQRDRIFDHYEDDGVFYNKRPSVWIEPLEGWGRGAVQLVEIPTVDEIHDNIVAYWVPEQPIAPGRPFPFRYRIHWNNDEPYPANAARVAATYLGLAGNPGDERPQNAKKFVIDFTGGRLADFDVSSGVTPVVTASRGEIGNPATYPVVGDKGRFRAVFDLTFADAMPVDLRLYLTHEGEALTETWIYQFFPPALAAQTVSHD